MENFRKYDQPCNYDIQVRGSIDPKLADWFDGLTILSLGETETLLTGFIMDQAALHGVLAVIRTLNLILLSLHRIENTWGSENNSENSTANINMVIDINLYQEIGCNNLYNKEGSSEE
ncbi:MAG: hypothetical protein MUO67_18575 [Anaerolineales bacterium]|jgi:hypothetical protein|nr:hypothetical protein [Anaerolineales bacterium]